MKETLKDAWFLKTELGRQRWFFDKEKAAEITGSKDENSWLSELDQLFVFDKKANPNAADSIFRNKSKVNKNQDKPNNAEESLSKGIEFFASLQQEDGNWSGDYGGPLFLMPGLIFVQYITNSLPSPEKQVLMKRYLLNHQNEDGGWGLHIEGESTMFGTTLNYVSLVLLGHSMDDEVSKKAVNWIHENGGVTGIPPWGKLYLALLGLYDWKGLDALLPELWLSPKFLPIYPGNYWNHARMVYLPMSYLSGIRFQLKENELIKNLKKQLYKGQFELTNWKEARRYCCPKDDYYPEPKLYVFASRFLNFYDKIHARFLRKKALKNIVKRIQAEDIHTNHINLGPVNKTLNMLVNFIVEGKSENFEKHVNRVDDYLWLSEDGIKMNGYNGSQFWDTIFMAHALMEEKSISTPSKQILNNIEKFIDCSFIRENEFDRKKYDRSVSVGGWPFSTVDHGWPITDCTSEGMKAVLSLEKRGLLKNKQLLSDITASIDFILENQNKDGGWASYEKTRAPKWLEKMNPS
ncbi:MAG: prenyltransferase/squalene oxidase repeat-containing protein, partial [Crocinitomicaceae bacterium]